MIEREENRNQGNSLKGCSLVGGGFEMQSAYPLSIR